MDEWNQLMKGQVFITDLGEDKKAVVDGEESILGRYAVWSPLHQSESHSIVEIGSDLAQLIQKYKVPPERVCAVRCN